jgi:hypothetical protein
MSHFLATLLSLLAFITPQREVEFTLGFVHGVYLLTTQHADLATNHVTLHTTPGNVKLMSNITR